MSRPPKLAWDATIVECAIGPAACTALLGPIALALYVLGLPKAASFVAGMLALPIAYAVFMLPLAVCIDIGAWFWRWRRARRHHRRIDG